VAELGHTLPFGKKDWQGHGTNVLFGKNSLVTLVGLSQLSMIYVSKLANDLELRHCFLLHGPSGATESEPGTYLPTAEKLR